MALDTLLKSIAPEVEREMSDYDKRLAPLEKEQREITSREKEALSRSAESRKSEATELERIGKSKPQAPTLSKPPDQPDSQYRDPTQALGGMASVLAMIGSLATRRPLVAGLNAAAASMEGFHKGDTERIKLEREKYKAAFEQALTQNQTELSQYQAALQSSNFDINAALHKFRAIAAQNQDEIMMAGIEKGDVKFVAQSLKDRETFQQKIKTDLMRSVEHQEDREQRALQHRQDMAQRAQQHRETIAARSGGAGSGVEPLTPGGLKLAAELTRSGIPLPGGWSKSGQSRGNAILNAMAAEQAGGAGSGSVVAGRADYKAKAAALTQNTKDLAAIRPYNGMLELNGNIAIQLAEKAIATNSKLANKPLNWIRQNVGDNPDVAEFLAQAQIVSTESARVLNNPRLVGQLTDSARHEMQGIVNGDMPLKSFTRVVKRMQSDGRNRVAEMEKEHASLLSDMSQPQTRSTDQPPAPSGVDWTPEKEGRYQELLRKKNAQ